MKFEEANKEMAQHLQPSNSEFNLVTKMVEHEEILKDTNLS